MCPPSTVGRLATSCAHSRSAAANSACGTTRLIIPQRSAAGADRGLPSKASSLARAGLVSFGRIHAPPPSSGRPRRTNTSQKLAWSDAMIRSQLRASWRPPPAPTPCTQAMNVCSLRQMRSISRDQPYISPSSRAMFGPSRRRSGGISIAPPSWVRSAPDENATPFPVMTAARTRGSSPTSWNAASSAVRSGRSIAFRFAGRFSRSQATPSSTSYCRPDSDHVRTSTVILDPSGCRSPELAEACTVRGETRNHQRPPLAGDEVHADVPLPLEGRVADHGGRPGQLQRDLRPAGAAVPGEQADERPGGRRELPAAHAGGDPVDKLRTDLAERVELGGQLAGGGVTGPAGAAQQADQVLHRGCPAAPRRGTAEVRRPAAHRGALMEELTRGHRPPAVDLTHHRRHRDPHAV